jgi:2-polyprenyl-3-methyl-5-hydroxy-6-metoxy-1,4-benzoquinol methylase
MKTSFETWSALARNDIQTVAGYMLTRQKVHELNPDTWLISLMGDARESLTVLDFGCGIGRNTYGLAAVVPNWKFCGYDNPGMIAHAKLFKALRYPHVSNAFFLSEWNQARAMKFDCIFCALVLQHIFEAELKAYLADLHQMTKKLIVAGRRVNDDSVHRSTWTILRENGFVPAKFIPSEFWHRGGKEAEYIENGPPEDHHLAVYNL